MLERPQATDCLGREDPVRATAQRDASTAPGLDAIAAKEETRI